MARNVYRMSQEWKGKGAPNRLHDFEAAKAASRELMKRERCALPPVFSAWQRRGLWVAWARAGVCRAEVAGIQGWSSLEVGAGTTGCFINARHRFFSDESHHLLFSRPRGNQEAAA